MYFTVKYAFLYSLVVVLILFLGEGININSIYQINHGSLFLPLGAILVVLLLFSVKSDDKSVVDDNNRDLLLENSEQFFKTFEDLGIGMCILDLSGRTISSNQALCKIFGYNKDELINSNFKMVYEEDAFNKANFYFQQLVNGETSCCQFENQTRKKDGSKGWISVTGSIVKDLDGTPKYVNAIVEDISDKKNIQVAFQDSEKKWNILLNDLHIGVYLFDLNGKMLFTNPAGLKIFGRTQQEMLDASFGDFCHQDDYVMFTSYFFELTKEIIENVSFECRFIHKKGDIIWTHVSGSLVRDIDGTPKYVWGFADNITEKKKAQLALQDSEKKYGILLNDINIAAFLFDLKGNLLHTNPAAIKIFGRTKEEIFHDPFGTYFYPEDKDGIMKMFFDVANEVLENSFIECRFIHGNGNIFWTYASCSLVRDQNGNAKYVWGFVQDITETKLAQLALQDSEEKYSILLNEINMGLYLFDLSGKLLFANPAGLQLFGKTWEQFLNASFGTFCHEEDIDLLRSEFFDVVNKIKENASFECRCYHDKGHIIWTRNLISLVKGEDNKPKYIWGFVEDITKIKETQQELIQSTDELLAIYNGITEGLHIIDINTRQFLRVNKVLCDMLGYTEEEMLNLTFYDIHPPHLMDEVNKHFIQHVQKKVASSTNVPFLKKNKDILYIDVSTSYINYRGRDCLLGTARDVTERKLAEEVLQNYQIQLDQERKNLENMVENRTQELQASLNKLEETNQQLREANEHKSKFLSTMSHEFRTPLNAVLGFADLLGGQFFGILNNKQKEYVNLIRSSGSHLLDLINDLLDITKIDAGAIELQLENFSFDDLIEDAVCLIENQIKDKHISVSLKLPEEKIIVFADKRKCKQTILNLLSNACKFTPHQGSIEIQAIKEESHLKVFIIDSGIGIAEDQIDKIFSEFYQADKIRDANLGGTGIGLALSKRLIEIQGGEIGVISKVGEGSTFWFTLPIKNIEHQTLSFEEKHSIVASSMPRKRRILVVEDNTLNIAMLLDHLRIYEHNVVVAKNGKEALDLIFSHKPELILMDILMPVMDGLEATRRILQIPEFKNIPIIAMTASTGEEAKRKHLEAGCIEHIEKPFDSKELAQILAKYLPV